MPRAPFVVVGLTTITSVTGAVFLVAGGTIYSPSSAALAAGGMLVLSVIGAAGLLVAAGRWSIPVLIGCTATWLGLAAAGELSAASLAVIAAGSASLAALAGPWARQWVRRTPSTVGPPPLLTAMLLALCATPAVTGLAAPGGAGAILWAWSGWSLALTLAFARAMPGSLFAARFAHPAVGAAAVWAAGLPGGIAVAAVGAAPVALAWRREAGIAVTGPPTPPAGPVPFPPELVPPDVLSAAGLDDRGRPIENGR